MDIPTESGLERAGRFDELIRLYEVRARALPQPQASSRLLVKAAEVARDRLKSLPRAEELFRRAALAGPKLREPLIGLKGVLEQRQDAQGLAETLERLAVLCTGSDAAALWLRAADLHEQKLSRRDRAMLCFQSATRSDPHAREGWERLLALLLAERRLEAAILCLGRWRASAGAPAPELLADLYAQVAGLAVDDPERYELAERAVEAALSLSGGVHPGAWAAREAIAGVCADWKGRVRTLRQASLEERDRKTAAWMSLGVARLQLAFDPADAERFGDATQRCFVLWPAMPEAVALLVRAAEAQGELDAADARLERMARGTKEKGAQADLLVAQGHLRLCRKADPAGALASFLAAVEADPSRPDAVHLASELLVDADRLAEAVALWERHLVALKDRQQQMTLRLRLARLCQTELGAPEQARRHLEAALQLEPTSANAAFELCRLLAEEDEVDALLTHLDLALHAPRPLGERVALCESAALLEEERGNEKGALDALCRALSIDPSREALLASARAYADAANDHRHFAQALRRAAEIAEEGAAVRLWRHLAQLLASPLSSPEEAAAAWREVLAHDPDDEDARAFLGVHPGAQTSPPVDNEEEGTPPEAPSRETLRAKLEENPRDLAILQQLSQHAEAAEDWAELASLTERRMTTSEDPAEARACRARLAQLFADRLDRGEDAAALYVALVEEGERSPELAAAVERLHRAGVAVEQTARALDTLYDALGDHPRRAAALLARLEASTERSEQKQLATALAELHERSLLDGRSALRFYGRAVAADPDDVVSRAHAIRIARELGAEGELVPLLLEAGARAHEPQIAVQAFMEAAGFAEAAGLLDEAVRALQSALMSEPQNAATLSALTRALCRAGRQPEAEELLSRRAERAEGSARAALLAELAEVKAEAGRPLDGAEVLEQAIVAGFDRAAGLERLSALYESAGRHDRLAVVLERQVVDLRERGEEDMAARLWLRRAKVLEASLGDRQAAVKSYRDILEQRPSDPDALAALEAMLDDAEHGLEAARALLPAWTAQNEHRKLVSTLERVAQLSPLLEERVGALAQAGEVHLTHLRQPELAFAALMRAAELNPSDEALRQRARAAAEDADLLPEYAEQLEEWTDAAEERALQLSLRRELAEIKERKLSDRDGAIAELREMLKLEPTHADALRTLQRLHRGAEEWAALAEVLEGLAAAASEPGDRIAAFREVAVLHETTLVDSESAAAAWRAIAGLDATDREAALALDRLYSELNRPEDLAFALELRRAQEASGPAGRELAFRLAQLRAERLDDAAGALALYRDILEGDVSHAGTRLTLEALARSDDPLGATALELLDGHLAKAGDHARRVAIREARLGFALSSEREALEAEIRRISEEELGRPDLAFMAAVKAFARTESDRAALQPELERLAKRTDAWDALAEVYESAADELQPGTPLLLALLRRAAELRATLGEPDEATRLWQRVLEEAPQDRRALDSLSRIYEQSQNARNLSEVYARQAQLAQDPGEKAGLLRKAGAAYESAGDDAQAVESFLSALAAQPEDAASSVEALEALERIYRKLDRLEDAADALQKLALLADETKNPQGRAEYVLRRAALLERTDSLAEACEGYVAALALSPRDPQAVAGLERLFSDESVRSPVAVALEGVYRDANDARRLCEVLEARLSAAPAHAAEERLALINELAQLREGLDEPSLAFAARLRAFTEAPHDAQVRAELERLAGATGSFEELAAAYEDRLDREDDEARALELWRKLGALYAQRLGRDDLAARALEEVARRAPKELPVLEALARLYRKAQKPRELAHAMRRQILAHPSVEEQVNLLYELGGIAEEQLADMEGAGKCYAAILERKPQDPNAYALLGRVLQAQERYEELAALVEREIALCEQQGRTEHALDLRVRLGRLRIARLGDARGGLELFKEVLRMKAQHAGAVGALEELSRSESPMRGEAAQALEPVFAEGGDHLKLVQTLEARVVTLATAHERAAVLRRMAELYAQHLDSPEQAFITAARALREWPDDAQALSLCLAWSRPADAEDALADVLEEVAPRATDPQARAALHRALAQVKEREGDAAFAIEAWRRVLDASAQDEEALTRLGVLLQSEGRGGELLDVLKRQLAQTEAPEARADLLFQMGGLQADVLGDKPAALTTFRRILEVRPDDARTLQRLDALCEELGRWPELADVVARRLERLPEDARAGAEAEGLRFRLAQVREAKLLDRVGALDLYAELLAADPKHAGALARVEAMVEREPNNASASDVLLRAFRASGDAAKLAVQLEARASTSPDPEERRALLVELGDLRLDRQDAPELAFMAYTRAFRDDPNDARVRARLERAADAAKAWEELAGVFEDDLPRIADPKDVAELCLKLGHLCDVRLGEPERAVEWYERARTVDAELWERALPQLDRLYNALSRGTELAEILALLAQRAETTPDRVSYLFRLGQLAQEALDSPDRAADAYEQILAIDPTHLASARLLEELYETTGQADRLLKVLEHLKDRVQGAERERVLSRMAQVSAERTGDFSASIAIYRDLLSRNPRNEQAFAALEGLLEKGNQHAELHALLAHRLAATIDPREIVRLNDRLGRVVWKLEEKPEDAVAFFKAALERDARHKGALEALRELYESLERRDDLVIVLRRLVPLADNAAEVKALRIRLAETLCTLGRREEALDSGRRALEVEPHAPAELDRVSKVFLGLRAYSDAVRALEARAEAELQSGQRDAAVQTLFEVADLWKGPASRSENASAALERILELDGANRSAYEAVRELYGRLKDWRAYAAVTDRYLPHLVTEDEKLATLRELAQVREHKLGQPDGAFLAECRALELRPQDEGVREAVERLAEETGSHEELAAVYEQVADELPRGGLAEKLYLVLARVHDEKLDDADAAEAALRKILEFDPTSERALDALSGLFARRGHHREYVTSLEQQLEAAPSVERRKEILLQIARVYGDLLGDAREAAATLERALEVDADGGTFAALVDLYRGAGDWQAVVATLLRWRDLTDDGAERARLQAEVAQVHERELEDDEAAIEGYRMALELDPAHRDALGALERLYTKLDRPAELLAVFERQLEVTGEVRERAKILFKSAAIWEERYGNLAHADACIEGILAQDPSNLQAVKTLERLRRAQERWEELAAVLQHHAGLVSDPAEQSALWGEVGEVFHRELRQVDRAVEAFHRALELDAENQPAMHALGTLYERSGNWNHALEQMAREAEALGQSPEAVELLHRMGKINEDMLIDPASARACYEAALAIDPGYLPALHALEGIHQLQGDWDAYEKTLLQEAREAQDPQTRGRAHLQVAKLYAEQREDREAAQRHYELAHEALPDALEVAQPLADIYVATEEWAQAERMLDIVAVQMAARAVAEQDEALARALCRQLYRLGYVAEKLGRREKALGAYEKAYGLDATYLPALEGLGHLLVQNGRHEDALKVYQTILLHHREELTDLEVVEIYWQLGDLQSAMGQPERALNHFEKALGIDPTHEPSLRSLIAIAEAQGRFDLAADHRTALVALLEGEARLEALKELGRISKEKLSDPFRAIEAYAQAHRLSPSNLEVMDALYVLYRETRQSPKAAETLEKMLAEPELRKSSRIKRVWFALGEIYRDELREYDRAAMAFNAALDADYRFIDAFSALEAMLGAQKQWRALEENYARMIQRLPKTQDTHAARMMLWRALGDLYRQVLKDDQNAFLAYRAVSSGLPDDVAVQETFAELASKVPGEEAVALEAWRRALPQSTQPAKVVHALVQLHGRRKAYDEVWLAAQVAQGLIGEVGAQEEEVLRKLGPWAKKREQAQQPLTDRLWRTHLFHPSVRGPLADIMAILFEGVGGQLASPHAQYGLNPKRHRVDVGTSNVLQVHQYRYVSRLLGMDGVELYSPYLVTRLERMARKTNDPVPEPMVGIEVCHTDPVCLKVGGRFFPVDTNELVQKELLYGLGRAFALIRPELALSQRMPAERLEALFQAAVSLSVPRFPLTADPKAVEELRRMLDRTLSAQAKTALGREVAAWAKTGTADDVRHYLDGAELTAVRTGLFVAGDMEATRRAVAGETGGAFRVPVRTKIRDLLVFALSEDLHALRVAVGTSVEIAQRR